MAQLLTDRDVGFSGGELSDADVGFGKAGELSDADVGLQPKTRATLRGAGAAFLQAGQRGMGSALKGLGALTETPIAPSPEEMTPQALEGYEAMRNRTPAQRMANIERNPIYVAGQALEETAPETHPVPAGQEKTFPVKAAEMAGGFVPMLASGPAAPLTIGLQSAGEHISADYENAKTKGLSDDDAAQQAMDRALLSGTLQAGIFYALPKPVRAVAEKYLVNKLGAAGFARWLAGRGSAAAEGAILGGTSQAAENVVEGKPATEGAGASAAGLGAANLLLPWLRAREEAGTEGPPGSRPGPEPSVPPPQPAPAAAADLKDLQDALVRNQITQNRVMQKVQELTAKEPEPAAATGTEVPAAPESLQTPEKELTPEAIGATTEPAPAAAETITGQNGETAPEPPAATSSAAEAMPAEPASAETANVAAEQTGPKPQAPSPSLEREPDLLDHVLDVGKISLQKARAIQEKAGGTDFVPVAESPEGPGPQPDRLEAALERALERIEQRRRGRMMEGVFGAPVWLSEDLAKGAIKVTLTAWRAGKKIAEAIEEGIHWLREQNVAGFHAARARDWLTDYFQKGLAITDEGPGGVPSSAESTTPKGIPVPAETAAEPAAAVKGTSVPATAAPPGYAELLRRQQETAQALDEINSRSRTGLSAVDKSNRYALAKESRAVQRELFKNPEYVADLLRKLDKIGNDLVNARKAGYGAKAHELAAEFQNESAMLEQIPEKIRTAVYNDLVARGEIMRSESGTGAPLGRTMGDMLRWLKAQRLDSPKAPLGERLSHALALADRWARGKDFFERSADRVAAGWEAFKDQWRRPPVDDDFRSLVKDWLVSKQWTGLETHNWVREIRRKVPNALRRSAITAYLQADGDLNVLRSQTDYLPEGKWKRVWEAAIELTPSEQALARRIQSDFDRKLEDARTAGLLDKGRENYGAPQLWAVEPKSDEAYDPTAPQMRDRQSARNPRARLDPRDPFFSLERKSPSYFDGIMSGGVPRSMDIGDLAAHYNAEFHNSLADRGMIAALKNVKAKDGSDGVMLAGGVNVEPGSEPGGRIYFADSNRRPVDAVTKDGRLYRSVNHWALRGWKFRSTDAAGNPILLNGDFLVHPDFYPFVRNELEQSWVRDPERGGKVLNPVMNTAAFLKASKFASATFHTATIGEHALFHGIIPITRGVEMDPARNPQLAALMRHGLDLGFGGQRELFEEGLSSHGGIWGQVPGLGSAMTRMSDWLFKDYIPAIKVKTGLTVLDRNLSRYQNKLSFDQIAELTARQMNAAFGVQNWRLMGTSKTWLDVNRLLLTAPDFLLSRAKVVAQALKPFNREQRYFLLAQGALVYGLCRVLNEVFDGDPHWEPENALSVVHNGRAYSARFLVNDIYHLITNPVSFAQGRLAAFPRSFIEAVTQRDMRTGARISVPFETNSKVWRSAQILAKGLASWLVPVGFEGALPGAKGKEETGPGQMALALAGVGSHKYTAQTQMYQLAADYNRSSKDAAAQRYQSEREAEARGESAYRKLDALIDAGDLDKAAGELKALLDEGYKVESIARHYSAVARPFTGSNAREQLFYSTLTPGQKEIYARARQERLQRYQAFEQVFRALAAKRGMTEQAER